MRITTNSQGLICQLDPTDTVEYNIFKSRIQNAINVTINELVNVKNYIKYLFIILIFPDLKKENFLYCSYGRNSAIVYDRISLDVKLKKEFSISFSLKLLKWHLSIFDRKVSFILFWNVGIWILKEEKKRKCQKHELSLAILKLLIYFKFYLI